MNKGTFAGIAAIFLWSTVLPLVRSASEALGPLTTTFFLFFFGGILGLILKRKSLSWDLFLRILRDRWTLLCGFLFALHEFSFSVAVGIASSRHTGVTAYLINYLWPTLTVVLGVLILKEAASRLLFWGSTLALLGVIIAILGGDVQALGALTTDPLACALALLAAFAWALYSNLTRVRQGSIPDAAIPAFMLLNAFVALIFRLAIPETSHLSITTFFEIAFLTACAPAGYILWDFAMRHGNIILVGVLANLTPIVSTILASIYLSIELPFRVWLALILVTLGGMLAGRASKKLG